LQNHPIVIASGAKQSRAIAGYALDCFFASLLAMTRRSAHPGVDDVARETARRKEQDVDPPVFARASETVSDRLGRSGDTAQAVFVERGAPCPAIAPRRR